MRFRIAVAMASISVVSGPMTADAQPVEPAPADLVLAVTPNQVYANKGGYVIDSSGEKTFVNARCKAQLLDAGVESLTQSWRELKALDTVPNPRRLSCDSMVDEVSDSDVDTPDPTPPTTSVDPVTDPVEPVVDPVEPVVEPVVVDEPDVSIDDVELHVTSGTSSEDRGGFVVVDSRSWSRVQRECKEDLIAAGIATVDSSWSVVSTFERAELPCEDIRAAVRPVADPGPEVPDTPDAPETPDVPDTPDVPHDPGTHGGGSMADWLMASDEDATYSESRVGETYQLFDPENHSDPTWGSTRIGWLVECDSVKFQQVDPIVAPGQTSHHMHEFFGNPNVSSTSTTQSFADTPTSDIECTDVNDKSAYWSPAVFQDGQRVTAGNFKAYYKSTTANTVPMPFGLRMIAGNAGSTGDQGELVGWFEVQRTSDLTPREDLTNTLDSDVMISRPNDENNIVLRLNFPNCWDGIHLDSPDHQSHVAYFNEASQTCPSTHPVKIPQLTTFTQYDVDGGEGFSLASGPWHTYHQDFWNAWSPEQMDELNEVCILDQLNCRVRSSGALQRLGQYSAVIPA